ncbi:MAG: tetratricopeptide repeat protein [Methanospirillum sp.]|nr:tetratricopeptide repeat protein [Methanospirillum sp.]
MRLYSGFMNWLVFFVEKKRDSMFIHPAEYKILLCTLTFAVLFQSGSASDGMNESYEQWFKDGMQFYQEGRLDKAQDAYEHGLAFEPDNPSLLNNLGNVLSDKGDNIAALARYEQALAISGDDSIILGNIGRTLFLLGEYEEAIKMCNNAIKLDPENSIAWYYAATAYYELNRYDESIDYFHKALNINQSFALAWNNLGNVHVLRGEYNKAFMLYNKALESDRNLTQAWYNVGSLFFALERYCESAKAFEEVVRIKSDDIDALARLNAALELCA